MPGRCRSATFAAFAIGVVLLGGCATSRPTPVTEGLPGQLAHSCGLLADAWDAAISVHGVADAGAARLASYPFLRVNRFLAAAIHDGGLSLHQGVKALAERDRRAREYEWANLPPEGRRSLGKEAPVRAESCRQARVEAVLSGSHQGAAIVSELSVPDSYSTIARVFGFYPLTSLSFLGGVAHLHASMANTFSVPLDALPQDGRLQRFSPPVEPVGSLRSWPGGPEPGVLAKLFARHAPVFEIDVGAKDDLIGVPHWRAGKVTVNTGYPVVYLKASRSRFEGHEVLQLNYIIWFPSRPLASSLDLLAGTLDGLTWRVTLGRDGTPLIYDAMHNCGCYHLFFPTAALRRLAPPKRYEEPPFIAKRIAPGAARLVIRLASRTHYIQRVYALSARRTEVDSRAYNYADYDALRSLPVSDGGRRSLFGPDGLVPGTERSERYLFWPMGVLSAGAMRQWGHHATAFVGRRHFDDPDLIGRYFEPVPPIR